MFNCRYLDVKIRKQGQFDHRSSAICCMVKMSYSHIKNIQCKLNIPLRVSESVRDEHTLIIEKLKCYYHPINVPLLINKLSLNLSFTFFIVKTAI